MDGYTDPQEALDAMVSGSSDWNVVIVDYMMPGLKGTALAKRMKKLQPYLCIIMITGLVDREALKLRQDCLLYTSAEAHSTSQQDNGHAHNGIHPHGLGDHDKDRRKRDKGIHPLYCADDTENQ